MNDDEQTILEFLRQSPEAAFARREIARRAVKRTVYEQNQHWADRPLSTLVARDLVEIDNGGLYRLRKDDVLR